MRASVAIAALLVLLVGTGAYLGFHRNADPGERLPAPPAHREIASPAPVSPAPRLEADVAGALSDRMTAVEHKLDELAAAFRALAERSTVPALPMSEAELAAAAKRYDPEELRRLFTSRLDEMQGKLDEERRQRGGKSDLVLDSHQMDVDHARQQLAEARDADALVRLHQSEFKKTFALPR